MVVRLLTLKVKSVAERIRYSGALSSDLFTISLGDTPSPTLASKPQSFLSNPFILQTFLIFWLSYFNSLIVVLEIEDDPNTMISQESLVFETFLRFWLS